MAQDTLGILLALTSAICFAANRSLVSKPLLKTGSMIPTYISLLVGIVVTGMASLIFGQEGSLLLVTIIVVAIFSLVGVFHFGIARQLSFVAIKNVGANQSASLLSSQVLYSIGFAIALLGESVNVELLAGAGLILAGVLVLERRSGALRRGGNAKKGYTAALLAALIFGLTPILIRYGNSIFQYFIVATFIAYVAATIIFSLTVPPRAIAADLRGMPRSILGSYIVAGIFAASAQLSRFGALSFSPVVLVAPLLAAHPIFTMLFTRKLAKEFEAFNPRLVLSILFVVLGALLVSYSAGIVS